MRHPRVALTFAVLSTGLSSIGIVYQAIAAKTISPFALSCVANLVGAFCAAALLLLRREAFHLERVRENWRHLAILTVIRGIIGGPLVWWAMGLTLGIKAMFFTKAEPYFVLLWRWIFHRAKIDREHALLLGVHVAGAFFLAGDRSGGDGGWGDFALLGIVGMLAITYSSAAKLSNDFGPLPTMFFSQLFAGLALLPAAVLGTTGADWNMTSLEWRYAIIAILLWNGIGMTFWLLALRDMEPWKVSAVRVLGPIVAAPFAWLAFDQVLSATQLLGAFIVLGTSGLIVRSSPVPPRTG